MFKMIGKANLLAMKRIETNLDMSQIGTNNNILFFWDMLNSTILLYKRRKKLKFEAEIGEKLRSIGKKHKKSDMVAFWFCSSGEEFIRNNHHLTFNFSKNDMQ